MEKIKISVEKDAEIRNLVDDLDGMMRRRMVDFTAGSYNVDRWSVEEVDFETLKVYIECGYAIKINC